MKKSDRRYCSYWPYVADSSTSSETTKKLVIVELPKEVRKATSAASRPVAISTRPIRGLLLRASKAHHLPIQVGLEPRAEVHGQAQRARRYLPDSRPHSAPEY
jgi:hypothetical protein